MCCVACISFSQLLSVVKRKKLTYAETHDRMLFKLVCKNILMLTAKPGSGSCTMYMWKMLPQKSTCIECLYSTTELTDKVNIQGL